MEMAGSVTGNIPKSYSLNMFKDFVPMCVFSEASQGQSFGSLLPLLLKYSSLCVLSNAIIILNFANIKFVPLFRCELVQ